MMPEGESPLLLPANQHKQLVVIDFEYANANLPGLEFANHFVRYIVYFPLLVAVFVNSFFSLTNTYIDGVDLQLSRCREAMEVQ